MNVQQWMYSSHFPSDHKALLFECLVVKNILVCRKGQDSSCYLLAKDSGEHIIFVEPQLKICINEVDTKVIDLNENINHVEHWKLDAMCTLMMTLPGFTFGKGMVVF